MAMKTLRQACWIIAALALPAVALAATTQSVVDVPVAGGTVRILHLRPDAPVATIVSIPGGDGILALQADGSTSTVVGQCNPAGRVRQTWADQGYAVALVDANSRGEVRNPDDLLAVIQYLRARQNVPVWIIGGSASTAAVVNLAATRPADVQGLLLNSPMRPPTATAQVTQPTLVVAHSADPDQFGNLFYNALTAARARERVFFTGGNNGGCTYHLFQGLDAEFAAAVSGFISRNNASAAPNYTDLWWNPNESGWGINFHHQGNTLFGALFTYDTDRAPLWLVMSNGVLQADGVTFTGDLFRVTGPAFNAVPFTPITPANVTRVGPMTVTFGANNTASLRYTVNTTEVVKSIERQVYGNRRTVCTATTASRAAAAKYQDLWWNANESGWGLNIIHQDDVLFGTLFTYDGTGRNMWLVMTPGVRQPDGSYLGELYRTDGPVFNATPFTGVGVNQVGTMRLTFSNGENATLRYTVNGVEVTKAITRQVFGATVPVCN